MYRQGLGDCFLITLPRHGAKGARKVFHIMIDCGVILGTADAATKMTKVVDDIVDATAGEIDLLVVTHEHWDHVSGFAQAEGSFKKLNVHELWLAWTEDPSDPLATRLRHERNNALAALRLGLVRLELGGDTQTAEEIGGLLEFFGARGASTSDALEKAKALAPKTRFCRPSDEPIELTATGVSVYVLGPPPDEKRLKKINPSKRDKETYGLALADLAFFLDGPSSALKKDGEDPDRPFHPLFEIPLSIAREMEFFQKHYWSDEPGGESWRRIDMAWLLGSAELALQLDSLTNNTSLVLAIELANGEVLLFAADAQVGNWLSWHDLEWNVKGQTVAGSDLLRKAVFYKVGHHASHNATLKDKGLELMQNLRVAMVPVDQQMARKKRWNHIPLPELLDALERIPCTVVRADKPLPKTNERLLSGDDGLYYELML